VPLSQGFRAVAAPAFLSGEAKGEDIFRGQVYMVANNAFSEYGTHTPFFIFPKFPSFPLISFSFCFPWFLSFPSLVYFISISLPLLHTAKGSGGALGEPGRQMEFGEFRA